MKLKVYLKNIKTEKDLTIVNKKDELLVKLSNEKIEKNKELVLAFYGNFEIIKKQYLYNKIIVTLDTIQY